MTTSQKKELEQLKQKLEQTKRALVVVDCYVALKKYDEKNKKQESVFKDSGVKHYGDIYNKNYTKNIFNIKM